MNNKVQQNKKPKRKKPLHRCRTQYSTHEAKWMIATESYSRRKIVNGSALRRLHCRLWRAQEAAARNKPTRVSVQEPAPRPRTPDLGLRCPKMMGRVGDVYFLRRQSQPSRSHQ